MTSHSQIRAAALPEHGQAPARRFRRRKGTAPAYSYRTTFCEAHDTATAHGCDECIGGIVDAACTDCNNVLPLSDEGVCEKCWDAGELPVELYNLKWLGSGLVL